MIASAMLVSAYAPLLVLLAALGTWKSWYVRGSFIVLAIAGVAALWLFLHYGVGRRSQSRETIWQAKPRDGEALKFLASYVIPFFITTTAPPDARWGLVVYLVLLVALYLRGDLYFSNPVLALIGYRVYEITTEDRRYMLTLSKRVQLMPNQVVWLVSLGGYVFVEGERRSRQRTRNGGDAS